MAPPNGSDSERLMAQIEAYLRTGEGPPAAPEPPATPSSAPPSSPPRSPSPSDPTPLLGGPAPRSKLARRLRRARRRLTAWLRRTRLWRRMDAAGNWGREGSGGVMHPSGGRPSRRSEPQPPRWTVTRVVLVVGFLVGLLLVPVIWKKSSSGGNPDGADHASAAPAGPGYSFLMVNRSGTPVRWNPCDPIYYQLDLSAAPPWAETDIGDAISSISAATGIQFVYEGSTTEFPDRKVPAGSAAAEPPPVVIAWATPTQSRALDLPDGGSGGSAVGGSSGGAAAGSTGGAAAGSAGGGSAGGAAAGSAGGGSAGGAAAGSAGGGLGVDELGRTVPVVADDQVTGHKIYVTGSIVISAAASDLAEGFGAGGAGVMMLHQLGRLVGLADIDDSHQVMNPDALSTQVTGLGSGDRAGLERLGRDSGCLKVPPNPAIEPVL